MQLIPYFLILFVGFLLAAVLFKLTYLLLRVNKTESNKSSARVKSIWESILGKTRTHDDWLPDARVIGGLIFNRKKKRIEITGRLSNSSLDRVYRRN